MILRHNIHMYVLTLLRGQLPVSPDTRLSNRLSQISTIMLFLHFFMDLDILFIDQWFLLPDYLWVNKGKGDSSAYECLLYN